MHPCRISGFALWILLLCSGFDWPGQRPGLSHTLQHGSTAERRDSVRRMAYDDGPEATELLLQALEDRELTVQLAALTALTPRSAGRALPVLSDLLLAPESSLRTAALRAIRGYLQQASAAPSPSPAQAAAAAKVAERLSDPEPGVRAAAAVTLAHAGTAAPADAPARVQATLNDLLGATEPKAQRHGWDALLELPAPLRVAVVEAQLPRIATLPPDLQPLAITAASEAATPTVLQTLMRLLSATATPTASRIAACQVLAGLGAAHPESARLIRGQLLHLLPAGGPRDGPADGEHLLSVETQLAMCALAGLGALGQEAEQATLALYLGDPQLTAVATAALQQALQRHAQKAQGQPGAVHKALGAALDAADAPASIARITRQLWRLALDLDLTALRPALQAAQQRTDDPNLAWLRAQVGDNDGVEAVLRSLTAPEAAPSAEANQDRAETWITVQRLAEARGLPLDSEVLNALLTQASPEALPPLLRLLGMTDAPASIALLAPYLSSGEANTTRAALDALARLGRSPQGAACAASSAQQPLPEPLHRLLLDPQVEPSLRAGAALALGALTPIAQAPALAPLLRRPELPRLALLVGLSARIGDGVEPRAEDDPAASALEQALGTLTAADDDALARAAIYILAGLHLPGAPAFLARALQHPELERRVTAATALGLLPSAAARPLLRYELLHGSVEVRLGAVLGLAEAGDERDLTTLLKLTRRDHWPMGGAVTFAIGRWLQRSAIRPRVAERALCRLATLAIAEDPLVRTNVGAALATAQAGPCPGGLSPEALLAVNRPEAERMAGARWQRAALQAGRIPAMTGEPTLGRCATTDPSAQVRMRCRFSDPAAPSPNPTLTAYQVTTGTGAFRGQARTLWRCNDGAIAPLRTGPQGLLFSPHACATPPQPLDPTQLPPSR